MNTTVLFVDDEEHLRRAATQTFDLAGIEVTTADGAENALDILNRAIPSVVVTDIRMPGLDGVALLRRIKEQDPELPVILLTGHGDVDLAVQCIKDGAYDFLEKPCEPARLVACVERAAERRCLTLENRALRAQIEAGQDLRGRLLGRSAEMERLRGSIAAIAATDTDVLIIGETGTGKEVAARALHDASPRSNRPFVHINCAALPETLIESELFGHDAGAFPSATRTRYGKFEHANRSTLCLDEIDLLSMPLQAKLLDVLQNRRISRLGSNEVIDLDIRIVALSKVSLEQAVADGRFRSDLFYRLNVVTLEMPTLSRRREDIPLLFQSLVNMAASRHGKEAPPVSSALLSTLAAAHWPGNVRELGNEAERLVLGLPVQSRGTNPVAESLSDRMAAYEKTLIAASIRAHKGRLKETYESLQISRKSLYDKMQRYGLTQAELSDHDDG